MTRDEEADEEEVTRGRDKDCHSDVATRRLVSPGDSKRPARFSRPAEAVKLARSTIPEVRPGRNQFGAPIVRNLECNMSGLGVATSPRRDAHLAEKRISMLRNKKEKDVEIENEL